MTENMATAPDPALQGVLATGKLFQALAADPKYRTKVLGLIKEAAPGTIIPELDLTADVEARVTERLKPVETSSKAVADRVEALERELARKQMQERNQLSDAELADVETFAKEHEIKKGDSAVTLWRQQTLGTPRATPPGTGISAEDRKKLYRNPKAWALEMAPKVLREIRGGRG